MLQNDVKWLFTYTGANMQLSAADFLHATNVLPVCTTGNCSAALCSLLRGVRLTICLVPAYHVPSWANILPLCLRMRSNHKITSNHMLLVSKEKIWQRGFEFRDENGSKPPAPLSQQKWLHSVSTPLANYAHQDWSSSFGVQKVSCLLLSTQTTKVSWTLFTFLHECNSAPFTLDATIMDMDLPGSAIPHLPPYWSTDLPVTCPAPTLTSLPVRCKVETHRIGGWQLAQSGRPRAPMAASARVSIAGVVHMETISMCVCIGLCMYTFF